MVAIALIIGMFVTGLCAGGAFARFGQTPTRGRAILAFISLTACITLAIYLGRNL